MTEVKLKRYFKLLQKDLNILREREAKYGGNTPIELLNQIDDHKTAIERVEARLAGHISDEQLIEQLAPLNVNHDYNRPNLIPIPTLPLVIVSLSVLGLLGFIAYRLVAPSLISGPTQMKGYFKVAVAEFGQVKPDGQLGHSSEGSELSQGIYDGLKVEFDSLPPSVRQEFLPSLWHDSLSPQEKGVTIGLIPDYQAAVDRADKINADVLIYGNLRLDGDTASFTPEFYVKPIEGEADEIVGRYQFGAPIDLKIPFSLDEQGLNLNKTLISRVRALSRFTIGLMYDRLGDSDDALDYFQRAVDDKDLKWQDSGGKEIFYYFLGRSALFLDQDVKAETAFRQALELTKQQYARAYIGLGGVYLRRARRLSPDQRLNTSELAQAIENYQQAIARADESLEPYTKITAQLGLGTAYRLQGETYFQLRDDVKAFALLDQAIVEIQPVLAPMQAAKQYRYLGQAYLSLGAAYAQQANIRRNQGDQAGSATLYQQARQAYADCIAQGKAAVSDKILSEKIVTNCSQYDQVAAEALATPTGGP